MTPHLRTHFLERGFTRRQLARISLLLASARSLPFLSEPSLAWQSTPEPAPAGAVKLDANENPLGPCAEALEAVRAIAAQAGRYMFDFPRELEALLASSLGLPSGCVQVHFGSSMPLHWSVLAFTSPSRPYVAADTTFEAGESAARFIGAEVIRVPLTSRFAHDVRAMTSAHPNAGLIYVCNPNNPTGTLTSRADLEYLLDHKPRGCVVLVDEAYIHYSTESGLTDLVAAGKDLVVLRTFSKIYGMAGLRVGVAIARPDLLARIRLYGSTWMPVTSVAAAIASLKVPTLVSERRSYFSQIRDDLFSFLKKHGIPFIPSVANFCMIDVGRPAREVIAALRSRGIYVGRSWPSQPTHIRVTLGTPEEMARFKPALLAVLSRP